MNTGTITKSLTLDMGLILSVMALIDVAFNLPTLATVTLFLMGLFGTIAVVLNFTFFFNPRVRMNYSMTRDPVTAFVYPLISVLYAISKDATFVTIVNTIVLFLPVAKGMYAFMRPAS